MRKYTYLIMVVVLAVILVAFGQNKSPEASDRKFSDLTLTAMTIKNEFLPMEPIGVLLTLDNETPDTIEGRFSLKLYYSYFEIHVQNVKGEIKEIKNAKSIRSKRFIPEMKLKPGEKYEESDVFYNLHDVFSEPGDYSIYIIIKDTLHEQEVKSNLVQIKILEPNGVDADAYDFLKKCCSKDSFVFEGGKDDKFFTTFSSKFAGTVYSDFSDLITVKRYIIAKQYDKAEALLQKMTPSQDFLFINEIEELKTKVRQLEKTVPKVQ
jgi:hypothetical protein